MNLLKDQFVDNNPWFKKVIHILGILSAPNEQIAFWRMRYAKNLRKEGLSAENALKLKRFRHIINMKIQKNLAYGYWKIRSNADSSGQSQTKSFVSLIKKY